MVHSVGQQLCLELGTPGLWYQVSCSAVSSAKQELTEEKGYESTGLQSQFAYSLEGIQPLTDPDTWLILEQRNLLVATREHKLEDPPG